MQATTSEQVVPPTAKADATTASADQVLKLIKERRSVFPKDFTGELVDRYSCCSLFVPLSIATLVLPGSNL